MTRFQFVRARLLARPAPLASAFWAAIAVGTPTLVRLAIDPLVSDVTFVTYYPFMLLAAMALGWRWATAIVVASALTANFLFMAPRYEFFAGAEDTIGAGFFLLSSGLLIVVAEALRRTVREVEDGLRREAELNAELQHRVKNTLTVVQGLSAHTFKGVAGAEAAVRAFASRLHALAEAHGILYSGRSEACRMPELASHALAPFTGHGAVDLTGPGCVLPEASCVPLVLALHELGTNAVKYGSLSHAEGRVDLTWRIVETTDGPEAVLSWRETGGPPVQKPTRRGLGSRLLKAQKGLKAVRLEFRPEGVACEIVVPVEATSAAA